MSSPCREGQHEGREKLLSRRDWLGRAGATAIGLAAPSVVRAACPCAGDDNDPKDQKDQKDRKDAPPEKSAKPEQSAAAPATQPAKAGRVLKVCADPNNLPFS